jgi:hypothetical protein
VLFSAKARLIAGWLKGPVTKSGPGCRGVGSGWRCEQGFHCPLPAASAKRLPSLPPGALGAR